ncbi:MAG: HAD-IIIC family phosphatase [Bryobacteraceae bacterium]
MNELRHQIDSHLAAQEWQPARALLERLWRETPTSAIAPYIVNCGAKLRGHIPLTACRARILRSFTLEPAVPLFRAGALIGGIDLEVKLSEFNAYTQEFLDPASPVYSDQPNIVFLAIATRDIAPSLWQDYADLAPTDIRSLVDNVLADFRNWIELFRSRSNAALVIHNLETPPAPAWGAYDQQGGGQSEAIASINSGLRRLASQFSGVYVLDFDGLIARRGRDHWYDATKWFTVRMPMRAENLGLIAHEWLRFVHPTVGRLAKVVVTDLDNTLWGGVIGEDGMDGIRIHRDEYKGAGFWNLQRTLADLARRGILLAVASKNNPDDALQAIDQHPGMLLRSKDFAATRIGWGDKATSLREIAAELNVGIDSLVFLDDNPVERDHVRRELPEVHLIELPTDANQYAAAVRACPLFERLTLSAEDRERTAMYAQQAERRELERSAGSMEDFYRSLVQRVDVAPVAQADLARVAQLTQKTNQFNLTTRRYNEAEIADMARRSGWTVWSVSVRDRFGDNGLTGVVISRVENGACHLDTFLMSCRVIGRTVESAVLSAVAADARERGAAYIEGWFLPTKKNAPSREFYSQHGFAVAEERDGGALWRLDLGADSLRCPEWIELTANINLKGSKEAVAA